MRTPARAAYAATAVAARPSMITARATSPVNEVASSARRAARIECARAATSSVSALMTATTATTAPAGAAPRASWSTSTTTSDVGTRPSSCTVIGARRAARRSETNAAGTANGPNTSAAKPQSAGSWPRRPITQPVATASDAQPSRMTASLQTAQLGSGWCSGEAARIPPATTTIAARRRKPDRFTTASSSGLRSCGLEPRQLLLCSACSRA